jgi:hypothetical protein
MHGTHDCRSVDCQFCEVCLREQHLCEMLAQNGEGYLGNGAAVFIMEVKIISQTHKA